MHAPDVVQELIDAEIAAAPGMKGFKEADFDPHLHDFFKKRGNLGGRGDVFMAKMFQYEKPY